MILGSILAGCSPAPPPTGFDVNFSSLQSSASVEQNIPYGTGPMRMLDIYTPSRPASDRPILVFFHGGLWQNGDKKDYSFIGQTMAQRGVLTIVANYSLYPQVTFPEFVKDGADVVAWVRENIAAYGGSPRHVFLMGHSAGAYIATMLALDPQYLSHEGLTPSSVAGVIGMAGIYDFLPLNGKPYAAVFQDFKPAENTQPINYASADTPPLLLITGSNDNMVDPRDTSSLAAHVKEKGGRVKMLVYPQTGYIGLVLPFSPVFHGSTAIVDEVTSFILDQPGTANAKPR